MISPGIAAMYVTLGWTALAILTAAAWHLTKTTVQAIGCPCCWDEQ